DRGTGGEAADDLVEFGGVQMGQAWCSRGHGATSAMPSRAAAAGAACVTIPLKNLGARAGPLSALPPDVDNPRRPSTKLEGAA
ncbi:hypothetical protein ACWCSH_32205, partial [Streptosporangium sp. NPDC001682]